MALATLHIAAIPLLAGLAAGTGAVATYVAVPAPEAATVSQVEPCSAQTWPYVDRSCVSDASAPRQRGVRVVMTERPGSAFEARWASTTPDPAQSSPLPGMTTSDGVLRAPQNIDAIPNAPAAAPPPRAKRSEAKPEKRPRGEAREVYVVRPLRLDSFR